MIGNKVRAERLRKIGIDRSGPDTTTRDGRRVDILRASGACEIHARYSCDIPETLQVSKS